MNLKFSKNLQELRKNKWVANRDGSSSFVKCGDLPIMKNKIDISLDYVKKYVKEHTSGIRYGDGLMEGAIISSFDKFVSYVNEGYNIIKAEVLNKDLISFEFERVFDDKKGRGGR